MALLIECEQRLDLHCGIERQGRHADGGAGMFSRFAQYGHDQVRCAVNDLMLIGKSWRRRDESAQPYTASYAPQIAQRRIGLIQDIDGAEPRGLLPILKGNAIPQFAGKDKFAILKGKLP
jgi:hypothetical protein